MNLKHLINFVLIICLFSQQYAMSAENDVEILTVEEVGRYAPDETPDLQNVKSLIAQQTNQFRKKKSRSELKQSEVLNTAAQKFADYMAETDRYGHTADGREPHERTKGEGYKHCQVAENIGYFFRTVGYTTEELAQESVQGWINSPGHRENMLLEHTTEIGVGIAQSKKTHVIYAVQLFGRPRSLMINFAVENHTTDTIEYQLGKKTFSLEPRYTRTHGICQPQQLLFQKDETEKSFLPKEGEKFLIESKDDALNISVKAIDKP